MLLPTYKLTNVNAEFKINSTTSTTQLINGVTHQRIVGTIENEQGVLSNQVINYLGGNPKTDPSLHVIVGDNYSSNGWGKGFLPVIATTTENRFPNYDIIGGINADYFNMVIGIPVEAYVRDFEVLSQGLGYNRPTIGFKDTGEVVFGRPQFQGMELVIYNNQGDIKNRVQVERINKLPFSDLGTTVFFQDHESTVVTNLEKIVIDTSDYKTDGYKTRYFGKGNFTRTTKDEVETSINEFVIVSNSRYVYDLIGPGDYVVVQPKIVGDFQDVRFVVGAWELLVEDSVAVNYMETGTEPGYKNPRSAIGVKADGTVFFVTIDGRQQSSGMDGMTLYEVADLMKSFGAVTAYGLDGGGSTTMVLKENDTFAVVNSPSEGTLRSLSNAIFFARGQHNDFAKTLNLPDLSEKLKKPTRVYIDRDNNLVFDKVDHAQGYVIEIDGVEFETTSRRLPLNLESGVHFIRVKAVGDGLNYSHSNYTDLIEYKVHPDEIQDLIDLFQQFTKNENK